MLQEIKSAARGSVLETHPHYRTAIGVLGVLLPILLIVSSLVQQQAIRNSISAYYHTSARDWFVGTLWVLGVFLFFYRYRPLQLSTPRSQRESIRTGAADAWLGKIAGVSAVLVALLPTTDEGSPSQPAIIGTAHGVAAAILFVCLSLFPLLLFSQSRKRGPFYRVVGWLMIILLSLVAAHAFAPGSIRLSLAPLKPVLVIETLLIWTFGISWFEKGRELAGDEKSGEIPTEITRRVA
ncbi:MAG TPA: DUF998 domain-containing protein [Gemmatimonadaceae bacterium]|nr:DUF998 domain-containing protein [Gemmatimonadaceae bacterium]